MSSMMLHHPPPSPRPPPTARLAFSSGRADLGGLHRKCRLKRESRVSAGMAAVMDLPPSAMEDSSPFVPPSQYEVGAASIRVRARVCRRVFVFFVQYM